ncbi:hypothetical protein HON22_00210 [Candidatus Peregrinibacteria bacterium]|nr:hypothetical protein [Candidatus Peregrinibacteria bacterium]
MKKDIIKKEIQVFAEIAERIILTSGESSSLAGVSGGLEIFRGSEIPNEQQIEINIELEKDGAIKIKTDIVKTGGTTYNQALVVNESAKMESVDYDDRNQFGLQSPETLSVNIAQSGEFVSDLSEAVEISEEIKEASDIGTEIKTKIESCENSDGYEYDTASQTCFQLVDYGKRVKDTSTGDEGLYCDEGFEAVNNRCEKIILTDTERTKEAEKAVEASGYEEGTPEYEDAVEATVSAGKKEEEKEVEIQKTKKEKCEDLDEGSGVKLTSNSCEVKIDHGKKKYEWKKSEEIFIQKSVKCDTWKGYTSYQGVCEKKVRRSGRKAIEKEVYNAYYSEQASSLDYESALKQRLSDRLFVKLEKCSELSNNEGYIKVGRSGPIYNVCLSPIEHGAEIYEWNKDEIEYNYGELSCERGFIDNMEGKCVENAGR